jgi:hypothetical protein
VEIASKAIMMGDYTTVVSGIAYADAFTAAIMYVTRPLFAPEKILTSLAEI